MDEAGRGPLAGPVVAAAVILPRAWVLEGIPGAFADLNDSKQLTETQRDRFFAGLTGDPAVRFAIAAVEPRVIDEINILQATHRAMNQALADLGDDVEHALVDGRPVRSLRWPQTALVKGDSLSYSIAAASVTLPNRSPSGNSSGRWAVSSTSTSLILRPSRKPASMAKITRAGSIIKPLCFCCLP